MFYFDEDHMENDAPEVVDHEEEQASKNDRHEVGVVGREQRSPGNGLPSQGKGWHRASNSGSTTTSSTGSYCGCRFSPDTASRHSPSGRNSGFVLGRDSDHFHPIGGDFDDLDDWNSESDEQPAELVPLGMRSINLSGCNNRHRHRKSRSNFNDFYKLTDEHLGSGAYASVRTGVSIATGKEFAVKLVDKHEPGHTRSRIMREVETFNMCKNHPNIVQLHEWFEDHDYFYMVFEKMRGGPLLNHIQQKGFFTEQEASKVTRDIATALKYLHDHGIAHRDVKPENVLCSDFNHVSPVKLCDLDLASKAASPSPPKLPAVNSEPDLASPVGSAEFMAPEVVDAFVGDALKYDKRCDMWSLGVIVYIMLCGYPPFYGQCWRENCGWDQGLACNDCQENLFKCIQRGEFDFPDSEWENVSDDAKDLICHLLVKNVRERFTADDVLKHPWIRNGAPETKLQTPGNLFRNDSARDVHQMQENFNVMNRMVAARLSARMEKIQDNRESDEEVPAVVEKTELKKPEKQEDKAEELEFVVQNNIKYDKVTPVVTEAKPPIAVPPPKEEIRLENPTPQQRVCSPPVSLPTDLAVANRTASQILMPPPPPPVPLMPMVTVAQQMPIHVPQMAIGNHPLAFGGGGMPLGIPTNGMTLPYAGGPPMPFHPNQMINLNGVLMYPHPYLAHQMFTPQQVATHQQMYKFGMLPQQFMAPPPPSTVGVVPHLTQRGSNGYCTPRGGQQVGSMFFGKQPGPNGPQNGIINVPSATALAVTTQSAEHLETCQTAMARQDSKGDLPPQARETQVNV